MGLFALVRLFLKEGEKSVTSKPIPSLCGVTPTTDATQEHPDGLVNARTRAMFVCRVSRKERRPKTIPQLKEEDLLD